MTTRAPRDANGFGVLRLAFASLVVVSHTPEIIDGHRGREPLIRLFGTLTLGEVAVDAFFLISGYLILQSFERSGSVAAYLRKRVDRIYPGFVAASLVCLCVIGPLAGGHPAELTGHDIGKALAKLVLLLPPSLPGSFTGLPLTFLNASMWTIAYEFACYLLVIGVGFAGLMRRPRLFALITAALLAGCVATIALRHPGAVPTSADAFVGSPQFRFPALFCTGSLFYLFRERIPFHDGLAALSALALTASLFVPLLAEPALAPFGGYLIFWFAFRVRGGPIARIGRGTDISYGIYLYAWPLQQMLLFFDRSISPLALTSYGLVGAAAAGYLSWHLVERPFLAPRSGNLRANLAPGP